MPQMLFGVSDVSWDHSVIVLNNMRTFFQRYTNHLVSFVINKFLAFAEQCSEFGILHSIFNDTYSACDSLGTGMLFASWI